MRTFCVFGPVRTPRLKYKSSRLVVKELRRRPQEERSPPNITATRQDHRLPTRLPTGAELTETHSKCLNKTQTLHLVLLLLLLLLVWSGLSTSPWSVPGLSGVLVPGLVGVQQQY